MLLNLLVRLGEELGLLLEGLLEELGLLLVLEVASLAALVPVA